MKRSSDDGEEEGIEEPDGKRLRLEIAEGEDGQHIIQQVEEIEVGIFTSDQFLASASFGHRNVCPFLTKQATNTCILKKFYIYF